MAIEKHTLIRWQFGLFSLLVAIAGVSALVAWPAAEFRAVEEDREARRYYDKLGIFRYGKAGPDENGTILDLEGAHVHNAHLQFLGRLRSMYALSLRHASIDDEGVPYILDCRHLSYIDIRDTAISERGVNDIRRRFPNARIFVSRSAAAGDWEHGKAIQPTQ